MKTTLLVIMLLGFITVKSPTISAPPGSAAVPVIVDTDMSGECDDAGEWIPDPSRNQGYIVPKMPSEEVQKRIEAELVKVPRAKATENKPVRPCLEKLPNR